MKQIAFPAIVEALTFQGLIDLYEQSNRGRVRPKSLEVFRSVVHPLIEFWGELGVSEFGLDEADQFRRWRTSQKSIRGGHVRIEAADESLRRAKMLLTWAAKRGRIPVNPLANLDRTARYEPRDAILSHAQVDALLAVEFPERYSGVRASREFRALVLIMWSSGCRISEAWRNVWSHVNGRVLRIPAYLSKNGKAQVSIMSQDAVDALEMIRTSSPYLFPSARGDSHLSYKVAWRRWRFAAKEIGLGANLVPHSLRHTAASDMVEAGVPLENVSLALRHSTIAQTKHYAHVSTPMIQDAVDRLEAHRKGPKKILSVTQEKFLTPIRKA